MKSKSILHLSAAITIACVASAHASTAFYWTGAADSTFSNSANWSPGGWAEWNDYHFDATATGNFAINNSTQEYGVGSISLDSGLTNDITISGNRLLMWPGYNGSTGSITIAADSQNLTLNAAYAASETVTWDVGANRTLTFNGAINNGYWGAGNFIKQGAGTAVLSANNNFTGNTTISNGILEVTTTGKLYGGGYTASPTITVASTGTLRLNGWSWDAVGSIANLDYSRDRLVVNGGSIEYTGASNFNPGDAGSSSRNLTIGTGGATLKASSTAGQTWTISSGNGNLVNNSGLTLDGAGAGEIQNVIEGTGSVAKTGTGTWTLSGTNTYSGDTTVSAGVLSVGNGTNSSNLSDSVAVTVGQVPASGAKMNLNFTGTDVIGSLTLDGTDVGTGVFDATSHPTFFTGAGQLFVSSGAIADNNGTWASSTNGYWEIAGNWASNTIASGIDKTSTFNGALGTTVSLLTNITIGNLDFSVEDYTIAGAALTLDTTSTTPAIGVASGRSATISANLAGMVGLEKTGGGSLVLTGVNSYTGGTTVTGGTLELNNSSTYDLSAVNGFLTVASGATLKLSGLDYTGLGRLGNRVTTLEVIDGTVENTIQSWVVGASVNLTGSTMSGAGTYHVISSAFNSFESSTTTSISNNFVIRKDYGSADLSLDVADGTAATDLLISGNIGQFGAGTAAVNKFGLGKLVLSGLNTYTGNTTIDEGTLELADNAQLTFAVSDSSQNLVGGTGTATFRGNFAINTSAVTGTTGGIWLLVDRNSLTGESFESTFSVIGFTQQGDGVTWTMSDAKGDWSFSETSGELTLDVGSDYDDWVTANGVVGTETDDDDNDGLTNFEEYAFGLDPTGGSSVNPITVQLNKVAKTFSYQRRDNGLTDLTYSVWYSTDLSTWTQDTGATEGTPILTGEVETVEVTLSALPGDPLPAKLFIQVRAQ
jgi:autotransporter-associated beta strand protein